MPRADRLLALLDVLRRHRGPVAGARLAEDLGISLRSLYRDVDALRARGADIEGEAGFGYVLKAGFMLPPLMFAREEIEALVLGASLVAARGDAELGVAAEAALAKIKAVLPAELGREVESAGLIAGPAKALAPGVDPARLREAMRRERKVALEYRDGEARVSRRTVWPLAIAYFDRVEMLAAWCEWRGDFRHFRLDRISAIEIAEARLPRRRATLLAEWRASLGLNADADGRARRRRSPPASSAPGAG